MIAPYWDDLALHQNQGYILYGTYGSLSVAAQEVNEFMSRNQSVLNFKSQWVLVAQWNNVCPYSVSRQPCGANVRVEEEKEGERERERTENNNIFFFVSTM